MSDALTTYRITHAATVRSAPDGRARQLARLGVGREIEGVLEGRWVAWTANGEPMGYVRAGNVREVRA